MKFPETFLPRLLLLAGLFLICTCGFCACSGTAPAGTVPADPAVTAETDPNEKIAIQYKVCRTGGGNIEGWTSQHGLPGETTPQTVTANPKFGYIFTGWSDGVTEASRNDIFGTEDTVITANFSFDRKNLPILSITTDNGHDVTSKDEYIGATVSICNTGNVDWELSGADAEIRGRGNGTWTYDKKSYRLRFARKQNLLGLGEAEDRTWILMANHADRSMLRNYLAVDLANRLPGIGYNNHCTHVEVYLNGKYHGVYLLAEQLQVDAHRVDIGQDTLTDPEAADAGFFVEMDEYAMDDPADAEQSFYVEGKAYQIKSEVLNDAQFDYIRDYITQVDAAIREGDRETLESLVDIDSFVDGYLLEEFFKNLDAGWSSFYMHKKPGDKMVFGPFWDFDLAAGNNISLDTGAPEGIYVGRELGFTQRHVWYTRITQYEWFRELAIARWDEILPYVNETIAVAESFLQFPTDAFDRNYEIWPMTEQLWHFPDEIRAFTTGEEPVADLCDWLVTRRDWLDAYFDTEDALVFEDVRPHRGPRR